MSKTIVVCGAGPGWSYQIARKFAQEGYQVALVSRTKEKLETLAAKLQTEVPISSNKVKIFPTDLTIPENVKTLADNVLQAFGTVDVVFSGISPTALTFVPAHKLTVEFANENVNLLYLSSIAIVQAFLPILLAKNSGSIIFGGATSAIKPIPNYSGPAPALAAMRQYALTLNLELKEKNVFVGIVLVGAMISGSVIGDLLKTQNTGFPVIESSVLGDLVFDVMSNKVPETIVPQM